MAKAIPTATFRRAPSPSPDAVAAFVDLDDAPGDTPVSTVSKVVPIHATPVVTEHEIVDVSPTSEPSDASDMDAPAQAPASQATQARAPRERAKTWRRKVVRRADGRELRKQTFYLDAELSHRFLIACAERQYDLSEAIEEAVNLWLKKKS